eukprot:761879-Hanusia_phi.AAC.2
MGPQPSEIEVERWGGFIKNLNSDLRVGVVMRGGINRILGVGERGGVCDMGAACPGQKFGGDNIEYPSFSELYQG